MYIIYTVLTLTLNVVLTSLIFFRLVACKRQLRKTMGLGYGGHYSLISTVFVESAAMNILCFVLVVASQFKLARSSEPSMLGFTSSIWSGITPAVQVS